MIYCKKVVHTDAKLDYFKCFYIYYICYYKAGNTTNISTYIFDSFITIPLYTYVFCTKLCSISALAKNRIILHAVEN